MDQELMPYRYTHLVLVVLIETKLFKIKAQGSVVSNRIEIKSCQ